MDSLLAIGVGLVLRIVVDVATENDDRVGGVLVGLWEGVVLNHFVRRMPRSFDPYLGFGFRIFVDFLFTQSLSRLALVALWALVGMLLADIAPNVWRDSGLRHLYRQVQKDVCHVKRSVPHIRIENDLPSVRLFTKSRSTSTEVSGSIRSDRAAPSRSLAPSPVPIPRRAGRSPPGTFPDVSGWSETNTDVSNIRERVVTSPGPSPALIPSREHAAYEHIDTTHVATSQTQTRTIQDTTITITRTKNETISIESAVEAATLGATAISTSLEPSDDPSRHTLPAIPDDWVDIDRPTPAKPNIPVAPFQPDPDSTPEAQPELPAPTESRPVSILDLPPAIDVLPLIPDVDQTSRASRPPDQVPLPESRAASVIGGVYDQPEPRSVLRGSLRSRVDKAVSEIGVDPTRPVALTAGTQSMRSQVTSHSRTSWSRSKSNQTVDIDVPEPPPKEPVGQGGLDASSVVQGSELQTPAQVDPPSNILTQSGDAPPLLFSAELGPVAQPEQPKQSKLDQPPASAGVDSSPVPPQGGANVGDTAGLRKASLSDLSTPTRTPPPPFTEFATVPEGAAADEGAGAEDPVTQDETPTELTEEQKVAEEKRIAFMETQIRELEKSLANLGKKLDDEDDPTGSPANALESDLEDEEKTLRAIKARVHKKRFSEPPPNPLVTEISLADKSASEAQFTITSAVLAGLLNRDDAGPITIQLTIGKQKPLKGKAKDAKEAVMAFAKRHRFTARPENGMPGIINLTF